MSTTNAQHAYRRVHLGTLALCLALLPSCQTTSDTNNSGELSLETLNAPPEKLPAWNDTPLDTVGNVVGYLPRKSLELLQRSRNNDNSRSANNIKARQTSPTPSPSASPAVSQTSLKPKPKPKPTPKPKAQARPSPKPKPPTDKVTTPEKQQEKSDDRTNILRGKSIQESPLGPRQPIELY